MKVTEAWVGQAAASSGAPGADAYGICNDADVTLLQDGPERGGLRPVGKDDEKRRGCERGIKKVV